MIPVLFRPGKNRPACPALVSALALVLLLALPTPARSGSDPAEGSGPSPAAVLPAASSAPAPAPTAILLVAFGTSVPEARDSLRRIEARAREAFPGTEVRWAYTSHILRRKLAEAGEVLPTPEEALAALARDGFVRVAVQSLQVVPGEEFHKVVRAVSARAGEFQALTLGRPLMGDTGDLKRLAQVLPACLPAERKPSEPVLFMGHGAAHGAGAFYPALQYYLERSPGRLSVATVEGEPTLEDAVKDLKKAKARTVWLAPLMSVAGDHAVNDMAGEEADSWVNVLARAGITARPVLRGLGQCEAASGLWIEHLGQAVQALDRPAGAGKRKE